MLAADSRKARIRGEASAAHRFQTLSSSSGEHRREASLESVLVKNKRLSASAPSLTPPSHIGAEHQLLYTNFELNHVPRVPIGFVSR